MIEKYETWTKEELNCVYVEPLEKAGKRITELEAENKKLSDTFFGSIANRLAVKNERLLIDCNNLMSENFKLKAREEKLIKGLEFYADADQYDSEDNFVYRHGYMKARRILKELETSK